MDILKNKFILAFLFLLIGSSIIVSAQITTIQTQVLDLAERARDYFIEATKGNIVGQTTGNVFGHNLALGASTEDIQGQGGILIFLETTELITIVSDNTNDDLIGTNANSVLVEGLDVNFDEISEIVNLSGITSVNTTNGFIRVNKLIINEVGNYTVSNAGTITATAATSGSLQLQIDPSQGQSQSTHYTIPAGQNLIITHLSGSIQTGKTVLLEINSRANADDITPPVAPIRVIKVLHGLNSVFGDRSFGNLKFDEKTDLWLSGRTTAGGAGAIIEVNYDFIQYAIGS
ncbi:hypothetical protein LCGC14_1402600 [marine sediment metagenome]|uniref:Uncharacterized protein n=1 Tax=marine sediment metagenome TaxID=412755 RepID=A0A0F9JWW3_9ZZZZ